MYAVIRTGGKQYRVAENDIIVVDKLEIEGLQSEFTDVLLVADENSVKIGTPTVEGAKVTFEIVEQFRGEKIRIVKFKRRKHHMKQAGHRSYLSKVLIKRIEA